MRANLNGSNVQSIPIAGGANPVFIDLLPVREPTSVGLALLAAVGLGVFAIRNC
jgi:hypothetical protein